MQKAFMIKNLLFMFGVFFATVLFLSNFVSCSMGIQFVLGCLAFASFMGYERCLYGKWKIRTPTTIIWWTIQEKRHM